MSDKIINIEKYDIHAFEKEQKPYTMVLTDVIQRTPSNRMKEVFLWIFLESLPETWIPNKNHLMQHFDISAKTYERWMAWLNAVKLIEYRQERNSDGEFSKGRLVVLNGSKFSPGAENSGTVKIDGTEINKKKSKVIHKNDEHRNPKNDYSVKTDITRASIDESSVLPNRQKTEVPSNDAHINTIGKENKVNKKTNIYFVDVFSDTETVKNYIEKIIARRNVYVDDEIIEQGIFYSFIENKDKSFDSVNRRINIFLKKVREGKWNIPQGYKGITSQSIREKEEKNSLKKKELYQEEAKAFQEIVGTINKNNGLKGFSDMYKKLKSEINA